MPTTRPFRFGISLVRASSRQDVAEQARRIEALGYDVLNVPDHFHWLPPTPTLAFAAAVTSRVRLAGTVFANDFRHPAMLAREAATIDLLSDGRFELGLGAGWLKGEYDRAGIPFDRPGRRVCRLAEALRVVKALWTEESADVAGDFYKVTGLECVPRPVQRPRPPIFVGGGGKRMLTLAANEADIVGFLPRALPEGGLDWGGSTASVLAEKVAWVRDAAGDRFERLELCLIASRAVVTEDREGAARQIAAERGLTPEQVLSAPEFLIGPTGEIVERLLAQREQFGISYIMVAEPDPATFAPIVARLSGS